MNSQQTARASGHAPFFFLGEHPALDFLNTKPVLAGRETELLTDMDAVLRWFACAGLLDKVTVARLRSSRSSRSGAAGALKRIRSFRESLRAVVFSLESRERIPSRGLEQVNDLLKLYPITFQVVRSGSRFARQMQFFPRAPQDLLGILARLAAALFCDVEPGRIHKCTACVLHFRDTTKNGTRRWCSMQACGNRAKVAAYARRRRTAAPH